ncbi:class I SAM-dependent DNA methyltransferase [Aurantiacibacter odishensis]|uniref:class I SAM-dependent DNA methyltransferase n=1 Tax=Aurantiacibacter odishensis TaxID=1155476 RepID=UPI0013C4CD39|nr:methyltransferase domain-containing protein [Aurantiacibacter odishensis]
MANKHLDRVYQASGNSEMREIYDEWAEHYDDDVVGNGYLTPSRLAKTLARFVPDRDTPILDYGCGTGLSGQALADAGFTTIDGADLSEGMLKRARETNVYRKLQHVDPDNSLNAQLGEYPVFTAVGVISKGAAPPFVYDDLLGLMQPGALLAFSLNDLSLEDPDYSSLVPGSVEAGKVKILCEEYGPHLAKYGDNSGSSVVVIERLG